MKRKSCYTSELKNTDGMEELNVESLARRKESGVPLTFEKDASVLTPLLTNYPLALVLRLRVLQVPHLEIEENRPCSSRGSERELLIVCGISAMVMGSVAFIEERHKFNMSLGIPAGGFTVIAAAVSIHTSKGLATVPSRKGAGAGIANVLWAAAGCLLVTLIVQCCRTIADPQGYDQDDISSEEDPRPSPRDLIVIASVQIALAAATLLSAAVCIRIDLSPHG